MVTILWHLYQQKNLNSLNFETYEATLLDANNILTETNATLRLKIDTIDTGVLQLQGTCGSSYQTVGLTAVLNLNGTDLSIPTKSLITSHLGEKSASPYCSVLGAEVQWSADLGTYEVKGPRIFQSIFDANPDVTNPDVSWTDLINNVPNIALGTGKLIPYIVVLVTIINEEPLLKKLKFKEKK